MYVFVLHAETPTDTRTYGSLQYVWCLLYVYRDARDKVNTNSNMHRARGMRRHSIILLREHNKGGGRVGRVLRGKGERVMQGRTINFFRPNNKPPRQSPDKKRLIDIKTSAVCGAPRPRKKKPSCVVLLAAIITYITLTAHAMSLNTQAYC